MKTPKTRTVPQYVIEQYVVHYNEYTCDKCGASLQESGGMESHGGGIESEAVLFRTELDIGITRHTAPEEQWAHRHRDYCEACIAPIWIAINELIMGDPKAKDPDFGTDF